MTWTRERVVRLEQLWLAGYSATLIAQELRVFSRSAVLGKVHRLGLHDRGPVVHIAKNRKSPPKPPSRSERLIAQEKNAAIMPVVERMAGEDCSSGQIAAHVEATTGETCTPKRIVSLCRRKGIPLSRSKYHRGVREQRKSRAGKAKPAPLPPPPDVPKPKMLSLVELTPRTCRWPIGDPRNGTFGYCGHECDPAQPYCAAHEFTSMSPAAQAKRETMRIEA